MKENKNKTVVIFLALFLILGAYLLTLNMEVDYASEVFAAQSDSSAVSADCSSAAQTAFAPSALYLKINVAGGTSGGGVPIVTVDSAVVTDPVEGHSAIATNNTFNGGSGNLSMSHDGPKMKLTGLQCTTFTKAKLEAYGDGATNANQFNIAIDITSGSVLNPAKSVVVKTVSAPATLWGSTAGTAFVSGSSLVDGSDADSTADGEVLFGGDSLDEDNGGSDWRYKIDLTGFAPASNTDQETLTFIFTAE